MNRRIAARLGKIPTMSIRRLISLVEALLGLFDQTCRQWATGKARIIRAHIGPQVGGLRESLVEHAHHACLREGLASSQPSGWPSATGREDCPQCTKEPAELDNIKNFCDSLQPGDISRARGKSHS